MAKVKTRVDYEVDWVVALSVIACLLFGGPWVLYLKFGPYRSPDPLLGGAVAFGGFQLDLHHERQTVFENLPAGGQLVLGILMAALTLGFTDTIVNFLPASITATRENPTWREFLDGLGPQQLSSLTLSSITAFEKKFDIIRNLVGAFCAFPVNSVGKSSRMTGGSGTCMVHLLVDEGHRPWVRQLYTKFARVIDSQGSGKSKSEAQSEQNAVVHGFTMGQETLYFMRMWARHLADPYRTNWEAQTKANTTYRAKAAAGKVSTTEGNPFDPSILPPLHLLTRKQQKELQELADYYKNCDKVKESDAVDPMTQLNLLHDDIWTRQLQYDGHALTVVYAARANPKIFEQIEEKWGAQNLHPDDLERPGLVDSLKENLAFTTRGIEVGNWAHLRFSKEAIFELLTDTEAQQGGMSPTYSQTDSNNGDMNGNGPVPRDGQVFSMVEEIADEITRMADDGELDDNGEVIDPALSPSRAPHPPASPQQQDAPRPGGVTFADEGATPMAGGGGVEMTGQGAHLGATGGRSGRFSRERLRAIMTPKTQKLVEDAVDALEREQNSNVPLTEWEGRRRLFGKIRALKAFRGDKRKVMVAIDTKYCEALRDFARELSGVMGTNQLFRLYRDRYLWVPAQFIEPLQGARGKAGGLNFALDLLKYRSVLPKSAHGLKSDGCCGLPGGKGVDLFAILDCRHMALPNYFENTIPYFFKRIKKATKRDPSCLVTYDPDVASCQPPHRFQLPPGHEHDAFNIERHFDYRAMCRVRDGVSAVTSHGSGGVWRLPCKYHQLTKIEDTASSEIRILDGFQFRFCPNMCTVATPKNPADFLGAQQRWAEGSVQLFYMTLFTSKRKAPKQSTNCYFDKAYVHPKSKRIWLVIGWMIAYYAVMGIACTRENYLDGLLIYTLYTGFWCAVYLYMLCTPQVTKIQPSKGEKNSNAIDMDEDDEDEDEEALRAGAGLDARQVQRRRNSRNEYDPYDRDRDVSTLQFQSALPHAPETPDSARTHMQPPLAIMDGSPSSTHMQGGGMHQRRHGRNGNGNRSPSEMSVSQQSINRANRFLLNMMAGDVSEALEDGVGLMVQRPGANGNHLSTVHFAALGGADRELLNPPGEKPYSVSGRARLCRVAQHLILFQNITYWWNSWVGFYWAAILPAYLVFSGDSLFKFDVMTWSILAMLAKMPSFFIYARLQHKAGGLDEKYVWKSVRHFFVTVPLFAFMSFAQGTFSAWSIIARGADRSYWTSFGAAWSLRLVKSWLLFLMSLHCSCLVYVLYCHHTLQLSGGHIAGVLQSIFILAAISDSFIEVFKVRLPKFSIFKIVLALEIFLFAITPMWYDPDAAVNTNAAPTLPPTTAYKLNWDVAADVKIYSSVVDKSFQAMESMRTGRLSVNPRMAWRQDSFTLDGWGTLMTDLSDQLANPTADLVGGYLDGSNYTKSALPQAFATSLIGWSLLEFPEGYAKAKQQTYAQEALVWGTSFLQKLGLAPKTRSTVLADNVLAFAVQVGMKMNYSDDSLVYWGRPEQFPEDRIERPTYYVTKTFRGSEPPAESAAALAIASMYLRTVDNADISSADRMLLKARDYYEFANAYRGAYDQIFTDGNIADYPSITGPFDELAWAAAWLYKATGESSFLLRARDSYEAAVMQTKNTNNYMRFDYDNKLAGCALLLYQLTGERQFRVDFEDYLQMYMRNTENYQNTVRKSEEFPSKFKPKFLGNGLAYVSKYGTNYYPLSAAFLATVYGKHLMKSAKYAVLNDANRVKALSLFRWAKSQVDVVVGQGGRAKSYVVDHGYDFPRQPRFPASSCDYWIPLPKCDWAAFHNPKPNPVMMTGALVSGPDAFGAFMDNRGALEYTDVSPYWQAGLSASVAGLVDSIQSLEEDVLGTADLYGIQAIKL